MELIVVDATERDGELVADLAAERLERYRDVLPYNIRSVAFDPHLDALHCEPRFVSLLRSLEVQEPHLAQACPKAKGS